MKTIDKIESIDNSIAELSDKIKKAETIEDVDELSNQMNALKREKLSLENEETTNEVTTLNYLDSKKAVDDFARLFANSRTTEDALNAWKSKLTENGITITDNDNYLPRKLEMDIQTVLTRSNPVFPLFKVTNLGAQIVTRELTSNDEAHVHIPGTTKETQSASLRISKISPKMIYKKQAINEIDKRTINNFGELYEVIVAELAQRVIDKIVDLALVEGTATEGETGAQEKENGFISILTETDTNKVVHVDGTTSFVSAVEQAVDVTVAPGKKYLVLTVAQKQALLKDLRSKFDKVFISANPSEMASILGVDELILYRGSKKIKPFVMVEGSYAVDMQPLTRIEQFKIDTNENDVLVETPATGRAVTFNGIAVIDLAEG